jgi:hypothetical protein
MNRDQVQSLFDLSTCVGPSAYEVKYVKWTDVAFDKQTLQEFLREIRSHEEHIKAHPNANTTAIQHELSAMYALAEDIDFEYAEGLLRGDPAAERQAAIEKWSRIAAIDMIFDGRFSKETLSKITNFPQADYVLVVKRTQELVALISDITTQASSLSRGIPGA